ncbi:MAG TPA: hypothetical protein ENN58_04285 [bacterium]|nr:hypothetical protein [bacterium]
MDEKHKKNRKIEILCNDEQFEMITKKARGYAMSTSEFGLFTMINSRIDISVGNDPVLGKLERAVTLLDKGVIDKTEFEQLKNKIFKQLEQN